MHSNNTNYNPLEIQLAHEIAAKLQDPDALSLYLSFAHALPHDKLRELLEKVEGLPDRLIKRSRDALFTHLVNQYKQYDHDYTRD